MNVTNRAIVVINSGFMYKLLMLTIKFLFGQLKEGRSDMPLSTVEWLSVEWATSFCEREVNFSFEDLLNQLFRSILYFFPYYPNGKPANL